MDRARLQQILVNLLGNALKFTETGKIDIKVKGTRISDPPGSVSFSICVSDTGIGIDESQLEIIFDKFQQQEGQDSVRYGGTGLGLSICKRLATMMGGTISVESKLGKGSSFIVQFKDIPLAEKSIEIVSKQVLVSAGFQTAAVLVVDDVQDNRVLFSGFFEGSALEIHEAKNGKEALEMLQQVRIDLVFLDLRMPIMNGYETIAAIRQDDSLNHIPVIAVTASVLQEDMNKVGQYGFDGCLQKPIQSQELFRIAADYLPYDDMELEDQQDIVMEFPEVPREALVRFIKIAEKELLPEWYRVKDRGDFEMIDQFAMQLKHESTQYGIHRMVYYAEQIETHVGSFDILEVDRMMKQFPEMVQTLEKML
jgi:polar amino acid transport system substrate-binding protein/two-component system sensor histidine kinase EvgS